MSLDTQADIKTELLSCKCHSAEHIALITKIDDEIYLEIHLAGHSFFERIVHAVKYVFGYKSKYGDFEEIIISDEAKNTLIKYLS